MNKMTIGSPNHHAVDAVRRSQNSTIDKGEMYDYSVIAEFRSKLIKVKNENLDLISQHNKELTASESQCARLRSEVEKGKAVHQNLMYELEVTRKQYSEERMALEEERARSIQMQEQFKAQVEELQKKMYSVEQMFQTAQYNWQDAQKLFEEDLQNRDTMIADCKKAEESLMSDKTELEAFVKKQNKSIQELQQKLHKLIVDQKIHMDNLRQQKTELGYSHEREERLKLENEEATQRIKLLEGSIEAERAAHLESKFNSEIIQLRIRELEGSLEVEKATRSQTSSDLEMIRNKFIEVENAYNREKIRAEESAEKLQKSEEECSFVVNKLQAELEEKDRRITDLSANLKNSEESFATAEEELAMSKKHCFSLEEAYGFVTTELQTLVDTYSVSNQCTSGFCKVQQPTDSTAVLETLREILTDYQSVKEERYYEREAAKHTLDKLSKDLENSKKLVQAFCNSFERSQLALRNTEKVLQRFRLRCTHTESQIVQYQTDFEKAQHDLDTEKQRVLELDREIQKLTRLYQSDAEDKLTFLHGLYQQLVAGCVVIKQPGSMMDNFSWPELCVVLKENVDALISDLGQANNKVAHLECVSKNKADVIKDLQQSHEHSLSRLSEQMKAQENEWQKQRRDLEQHYSALLAEVQLKAQKFQSKAERAKSKIDIFEKTRNQMALENVHIKNLLINNEKDHKSLLAACALIAGALHPLYSRTCSLSAQRDFLQTQVNLFFEVQNEIRTLVQALSNTEGINREVTAKTKHFRTMKHVFRKAVVAVLASNRLRHLGKQSRALFTWADEFSKGAGVLVCIGGAHGKHTLSPNDEQVKCQETCRWFSSSDLLNTIVYSMSELLSVLNKPDENSQEHLIRSARNSFSKLMKKLRAVMGNVAACPDRNGIYQHPDSLIQRLAFGLRRLNSQTTHSDPMSRIPIMQCLCSLKKQIFELTHRLHAGEVERRSLRIELSDSKQSLNEIRKHSDNTERQIKKSKAVPYEKFKTVCEELNNALSREQQSQMLLNEQSSKLLELNYTIELHSADETKKNQTLSEAIKSLSEAKMELRRKDQSLHQLNRQLAQLEQNKRRQEENIHNADNALHIAVKSSRRQQSKNALDAIAPRVECGENSTMEEAEKGRYRRRSAKNSSGREVSRKMRDRTEHPIRVNLRQIPRPGMVLCRRLLSRSMLPCGLTTMKVLPLQPSTMGWSGRKTSRDVRTEFSSVVVHGSIKARPTRRRQPAKLPGVHHDTSSQCVATGHRSLRPTSRGVGQTAGAPRGRRRIGIGPPGQRRRICVADRQRHNGQTEDPEPHDGFHPFGEAPMGGCKSEGETSKLPYLLIPGELQVRLVGRGDWDCQVKLVEKWSRCENCVQQKEKPVIHNFKMAAGCVYSCGYSEMAAAETEAANLGLGYDKIAAAACILITLNDAPQAELSISGPPDADKLHLPSANKDMLTNDINSVKVAFQKIKHQMSMSYSVSTRNDFTILPPLLQSEIFAKLGHPRGPESLLFQNMIKSFLDIYQLVCSKSTALEKEMAFQQKHIAALKSELQAACLRESQTFTSVV
ncbi:LOW QUALITY PROTEIN: coiled-coil domain-containing protein 171 [Pelodytes ibericus]